MRLAVVGHVEWCEFAPVERVPGAGEIVRTPATWEEPGGAGAVAAVQLAKLADDVWFFTAVGEDELGAWVIEDLRSRGPRVEAVVRRKPQRRAFVYLDAKGERTITTIGEKLVPRGDDPLPWEELDGADAVYFVSGDAGALEAARRARKVVATSRALGTLAEACVPLDAVIGSGEDEAERYVPGEIQPLPDLVVTTAGREGGSYVARGGRSGTYEPAPLPGPAGDAYGAGDSFAACFTYALGAGQDTEEALGFAARCGAAALTGRGPYEGQLRSP